MSRSGATLNRRYRYLYRRAVGRMGIRVTSLFIQVAGSQDQGREEGSQTEGTSNKGVGKA